MAMTTSTPLGTSRRGIEPGSPIESLIGERRNNEADESICSSSSIATIRTQVSAATTVASSISAVKVKTTNNRKDVAHFKPRCNGETEFSCYYMIVKKSSNIELISKQWVRKWTNDLSEPMKNNLVSCILQLIIDVAGYQDYNVKYAYKKKEFDVIIRELVDNPSKQLSDYKYLLETNSEWSNNVIANIEKFVVNIVDEAIREKCIFNAEIFHDIFKFLQEMIKTSFTNIFHTGIFFALKFCSCLIQQNVVFVDVSDDLSSNGDQPKKMEILQKLSDYLLAACFKKFKALSELDSENLDEMYIRCLNEFVVMFPWLSRPHNGKVFQFIIENTTSDINAVRSWALIHLCKLMRDSKLSDNQTQQALSKIFGRIYDVDLNIATSAIISSMFLYNTHKNFFNSTRLNTIRKFVYDRNFPVASAAFEFIMAIAEEQNKTKLDLIRMLAKLQMVEDTSQYLDRFVELILKHTDVFYKPSYLIQTICGNSLPYEEEKCLLKMMASATIQILSGEPLEKRSDSKTVEVDPEVIEDITNHTVPGLIACLDKFKNEDECLESLLKITSIILLKNAFFNKQCETTITKFLLRLHNVFMLTNNESVMLLISEIIKRAKDHAQFCTKGKAFHEMLTDNCVKAFNSNLNDIENDDAVAVIELTLLRLSSILKHNEDISGASNSLCSFALLKKKLATISKRTEKSFCNQLKCATNRLSTETEMLLMGEITDWYETSLIGRVNELIEDIGEHLSVCFDYLKNDDSRILCYRAYDSISALYKMCNKEYPEKKVPEEILLRIRKEMSEEEKTCFRDFMSKHVLDQFADGKAEEVLGDILLNSIVFKFPGELVTDLFGYYNKFYTKYGKTFDLYLEKVLNVNSLYLSTLVYTTIKNEFISLINADGMGACSDANDLTKLTLQFCKKVPPSCAKDIFIAALIDCSKDSRYFDLAKFCVFFCESLPNNIMLEIKTFIDGTFSPEQLQSVNMRFVVAKLNANTGKKALISKKRPTQYR